MLNFKFYQPRRERRIFRRHRNELTGTMKYRGDYKRIRISDLSEHGAYVVVDDVVTLDDGVCLSISLPGEGKTVMISGRVKRVGLSSRVMNRPSGFGLEFTRFYTQVGKHYLKRHLSS